MTKTNKVLKDLDILLVSDTHINSRVALLSPRAELGDGMNITLSRFQAELWEAWLDQAAAIKEQRKSKIPLYIIHCGDAVEVDFKYRSDQIVTQNKDIILSNAAETLEPLFNLAEKVFWIRGTEAHVGLGAEYESALARNFVNTEEVDDQPAVNQLRKIFVGVRIDAAHHTSMGNLPWTAKNAANRVAAQLIYEYTEWGEPLPHFVFRGHVHRVSDSGMNFPFRVITLPCWTGATTYIHRIGSGNTKPHLGSVILRIRNGRAQEPEYMQLNYRRDGWQ